MAQLITIYTSKNISETYIVRSVLEQEGIPAFIKGELVTQTAPYLTGASNGMQLQVSERDIIKAVELLQDKGYIIPQVSAKEQFSGKIITFISVLVVAAVLVFILYFFYRRAKFLQY